jgi:hypothetical protein
MASLVKQKTGRRTRYEARGLKRRPEVWKTGPRSEEKADKDRKGALKKDVGFTSREGEARKKGEKARRNFSSSLGLRSSFMLFLDP